ncbi:hypothetical protein [Nonlabens tegetincola]|nr:hypothetical protein [Nonlabens tegetincola]
MRYKQYISILLIALFTSMQLMNLHSWSHDDDHETDCEVCVISHEFQQLQYDFPQLGTWTPSIQNHIPVEGVVVYYASAKANSTSNILFTRPPPVLA